MQIFSFDPGSGNFYDIEPKLRLLDVGGDSLTAERCRMLLAFVHHLRRSGPVPRMVGQLCLGELRIWSEYSCNLGTNVTIWPDCYDYRPRDGDTPFMYYRVNIRTSGRALSTDIRTQDLERVERALREAFGWKE